MSTPIALADFWNTLKFAGASFNLPTPANVAKTAGGEVVTSALGSALWSLEVTLTIENNDDAVGLQAALRNAAQVGASFLATPILRRSPKSDPTATVASQAVTINSLPTGAVSVGLAGLQAGYVVSVGDYIGWVVSGKYHLHQFTGAGTADASGVLAALSVVPPIRGDVSTGQAVTLVDVPMKCIIAPSSMNEGAYSNAIATGFSFTAIQSLRA